MFEGLRGLILVNSRGGHSRGALKLIFRRPLGPNPREFDGGLRSGGALELCISNALGA